MVCDNVIRNKWPMTQILKAYIAEEGLVRSVQLVTEIANSTYKETSVFDQLVNKLVLLVENEPWKAMFKNIGQYLDGRSANVRD